MTKFININEDVVLAESISLVAVCVPTFGGPRLQVVVSGCLMSWDMATLKKAKQERKRVVEEWTKITEGPNW